MVPEICSGQKPWTADGGRRTDIWITKSLPELSSGETKRKRIFVYVINILVILTVMVIVMI